MQQKTDNKIMTTESNHQSLNVEQQIRTNKARRRRRCLIAVCGAIIVLFLVLFVIILVLALTVFKPKEPRTELLSAAVDGVSPRISFPVIRLELNVTLDLKILVQNRNYASFRHGTGQSLLLYRENQVGEADIFPGYIPARGSATVPCRLTVEVDQLGSNLSGLIADVLAGELAMETRTRIPGRVTFLGFIKKHVMALSECQFTIGLSDMKLRSQVCKSKTKI